MKKNFLTLAIIALLSTIGLSSCLGDGGENKQRMTAFLKVDGTVGSYTFYDVLNNKLIPNNQADFMEAPINALFALVNFEYVVPETQTKSVNITVFKYAPIPSMTVETKAELDTTNITTSVVNYSSNAPVFFDTNNLFLPVASYILPTATAIVENGETYDIQYLADEFTQDTIAVHLVHRVPNPEKNVERTKPVSFYRHVPLSVLRDAYKSKFNGGEPTYLSVSYRTTSSSASHVFKTDKVVLTLPKSQTTTSK